MFENFLSVCKDVTKTTRKIPQGEYLSDGTYKIFDQGKNYIGGYCNTANGVASDYPYIVFGDHTRVIKYINEPCYIGADGVKLLKVYNNDFIPKFVYYAMLANPVEHQGYSRHFKLLKETKIRKYDKSIQNTIIDELDKINLAISLKESILNHLDELVKSRFIEMFVEKGFKEITFSDYAEIIDGDRGKNYPKAEEFSDEGYCLFLSAKNVTKDGFLFEQMQFISEEKDNLLRKGKLCRGDIVITTRGTIGNIAFYDDDIPYDNVRINSGMVIIRQKEVSFNQIFFLNAFKNKIDEIKDTNVTGAAQPQLPIHIMSKIKLLNPPIELQNEFADFVKLIDKSKFVGYFTLNIFYVKSSHFHHPP